MSTVTYFQYLLLAGQLIGALTVIGAPWCLVAHRLGLIEPLPAPVLGLGVYCLVGWYTAGSRGIEVVSVPLVVGSALATVALAFAWRDVLGAAGLRTVLRESSALLAGCFVAFAALAIVTQGAFFKQDHFTAMSLGNNDLPSYVIHAQALGDTGFSQPGWVTNLDLGTKSAEFGYGSYAYLVLGASVPGQAVWRMAQPAMFAAEVLMAFGLALLARRLVPGCSRVGAVVAGTAAGSVFLVTYIVGQYFLGQILGVAIVAAQLAVLVGVRRGEPRTVALGRVLCVGLAVVAGLSVYPHMQAIGLPLLAGAVAVALGGRRLVPLLVRVGSTSALGALLAFVLVPGIALVAWKTLRDLSAVNAGWPLPGFLLTDVFGFQTNPYKRTTTAMWLASALLGGAILTLVALCWRRGWAVASRYAALVLLISLGTYGVIFSSAGPSYRQWKWLTFFVPFVIAAVLSLLVAACETFALRGRSLRPMLAVVVAPYLVAVVALSTNVDFPAVAGRDRYVSVTLDQINVGHSPALDGIDRVNVRAAPYWETMWLAYFLRDREVNLLSASYFPAGGEPAEWTVQPVTEQVPAWVDVIELNASYRLVREPSSGD